MFCNTGQIFSLAMTCAGPSCSSIFKGSNLTCTNHDSESWQCNNGVVCSGGVDFSSSFSIVQSNETVRQTQNVSLNGTDIVFQQDGTGNATVVNGTAATTTGATTTVATTTSASTTGATTTGTTTTGSGILPSRKSAAGYSRQPYSSSLFLIMLVLGLLLPQTQATLTVAKIDSAINSIFELVTSGLFIADISAKAIAGQWTEVVTQSCGKVVGDGIGSLSKLPLAFGKCEEAMVGFEMSLLGNSLGLTLRSFAGLGGVLLEGLTAAEEATVLASGAAAAIPEIFVINSALCGLLITVIAQAALEGQAETLCAAAERAGAAIQAGSPSSPTTTTLAPAPKTSSSPITQTSTTSAAATPIPNAPSGLLIPSVAQDQCASCQLSVYSIGIRGLAAQCNVATPLGIAYDLSVLFCDSSYNGRYSQFCTTLCANPCATYSIDSWIQSAGSQFMSTATLATCANLCPGFMGNGKCSSLDTCECAVGSGTCVPC
jgi:hypothetical protein